MKQVLSLATRIGAMIVLLVTGFLVPSLAQAQRALRSGLATTSVRQAPAALGSTRTANNRNANFNSFSGFSFAGGSQVLAAGFTSNFPLLENNQDLGIQAAINPATQLRLAFAERFLRDRRGVLGGGGFFLLDGGAYVIPPDSQPPQEQQQQPQVIVLQQAPPQQPAAPAVSNEASAPIADVGQFTLVLRSGKQIQAVAFTRAKNQIVYIDTDGGRRAVDVADLDTAATARINEERGTPLQLPL